MATNQWTYNFMKELLSRKQITFRELEELKEYFRDEIDSYRRFSHINSLINLIDVLEHRDTINEFNIVALLDVADILKDVEISTKLSQYEPIERNEEFENEYAIERSKDNIKYKEPRQLPTELRDKLTLQPECNQNRLSKSSVDSCNYAGKKKETIHKLICTEIGKKWRDLGRELDVTQGELDALDSDYPRDFKLKVRKMLELFEDQEHEDPRRHAGRICDALVECGRRDLRNKILDILNC